jgi:crotonobetaine/carnitine-CoA ligase
MVAVFLPNGLDFVRVWLGLGRLGAVAVLLNTELTGGFLRHQLETCGAGLAVLDRARLEALRAIAGDLNHLRRVLIVDAEAPTDVKPFEAIAWWAWRAAAVYDGASPRPQDIACVMYTSGTSGPAKGVLMPYAHCYLYGLGTIDALQLTREDRYYIVLPLFHANGLLMQLGAALIAGIPAVVRARFSASAWLDDVRKHHATVTNSLGAIAAFIVGQPPSAADRDHQLRAILNVPNVPEHEAAFRERFGVTDVVSGFGMTEVDIPVWDGWVIPGLVPLAGCMTGTSRSSSPIRTPTRPFPAASSARSWCGRRFPSGSWPLPRHAGPDRRGLAQPVVPYRRCRPDGRDGAGDVRRPHQGLHPPPRREHFGQ